jgi:hypothetical protein
MENRCWLMLWIGLLLTIASLVSNAQTTGVTSRVAVYIPFDFVVADQTLPSGPYELSTKPGGILDVLSRDGRNHVFAQPGTSNGSGDYLGRVVFNCYGNRCFLSSVWVPGHDLGWELLQCTSEKKLSLTMPGYYVGLARVKPNA